MLTYEIERKQEQLLRLLLVFTVGGIFGFFYEEIFYRIDLGFWVKRGSTFGPWIPIYGFGAVLMMLITEKIKSHPACVFLVSAVACGCLEFGTGYVLDRFFQTRLWDYNTEIWNWGNVGGYICARSVLFFGFSALFFRYALYPGLCALLRRIPARTDLLMTVLLPSGLFVLDILVNLSLKLLGSSL